MVHDGEAVVQNPNITWVVEKQEAIGEAGEAWDPTSWNDGHCYASSDFVGSGCLGDCRRSAWTSWAGDHEVVIMQHLEEDMCIRNDVFRKYYKALARYTVSRLVWWLRTTIG